MADWTGLRKARRRCCFGVFGVWWGVPLGGCSRTTGLYAILVLAYFEFMLAVFVERLKFFRRAVTYIATIWHVTNRNWAERVGAYVANPVDIVS
jgi:hypothetical protein